MRSRLLVTYWLAIAGLQASAAPFGDGRALEKRQSDTGAQPAPTPAAPPAPAASSPVPAAPSPAPAPPSPAPAPPSPAPASPSPAPAPPSPAPASPSPAPASPSPAPASPSPAPAPPSPAPVAPSPVPVPPSSAPAAPSQASPPPSPAPAPSSVNPAEPSPTPNQQGQQQPSQPAPTPMSVPAPGSVSSPTSSSPDALLSLSSPAPTPQAPASPSPNVPQVPAETPTVSQGVTPLAENPTVSQGVASPPVTGSADVGGSAAPALASPSAGPASGAPVAPQDTSLGPPASNTAVSTGTGPAAATAATPVTGSDSASASPLSSPPAGSPNAVVSSDSSAAFAPAATTIGGANSECTTSNGLKGKVGPGGCFANAGQDCVVSQGIQGVTSDTGTCAPIASVGASCTLSDGTKGTAQLQGLGTSLSCIGESLPVGGACPLPFNVIGTLSSDGRTCTPPKEAPPAGGACPVPGLSGLGVMQPDGKTCLPPTPPTTSSSGGGGGVGLTNGAGCAIDGQPGSIDNGGCRALVSRAGDPCYRNGAGAFFSNAPPDGILDSDLTTCMVVNDTCNVNGVQGRWSPSYVCSNPPPVSGNPASDGDVCQRSHMWGGRWDAANSTCILPGDPCPTGIYGPNAKDCIAKPPAGSGCQTSQGFNGTFNDAGLCVATIPPGERTPCISVKSTAGTISITPNGTLCQIAPTPDTPQGLLQDILSGSYCSNGKDAGMFNDIIECEVVQRPGGLSAVPDGTPGNPRNDISSLQSVTPHTNNNSWLPGVIAACVVVGVALILGILAWKCGWFRLCTRKRRQHEPFGEGEGVLDETTYGPQPTFPTVSGQYRDYNPPMTSSPPTTTNRQSVVSDPYSDYNNGLNRQHHENSLSMVSDGFSTTDPFSDASNNESHTGWNQGHLSQYSHTNAGSVSADSGSQPIVPLSPPGSPPMGQLSPPGSPGQHVVHQPLLSGYPADPPAYPAGEQGGSKSPYR